MLMQVLGDGGQLTARDFIGWLPSFQRLTTTQTNHGIISIWLAILKTQSSEIGRRDQLAFNPCSSIRRLPEKGALLLCPPAH